MALWIRVVTLVVTVAASLGVAVLGVTAGSWPTAAGGLVTAVGGATLLALLAKA